MSYIENRLFHYFVAVAEEQHFARAAERLGITPPTLTHLIQKLESQLGVRLLVRRGHTKVVATEAGKRVLVRAREILRQVEEAPAVARQAERGEVGRVELGYMIAVCFADLLETWIGEFQSANPGIEIGMHWMGSVTQIAGIVGNELDAGFTRTPHKYPAGLKGIEIYREPLMLALPGEHPLGQHKEINPAMLKDETFVNTTSEVDVGFFGYTGVVAAIGNFTPRVSRRDNDFITLLTFVRLGYGIAVVPQLMTRMNFPNVVFRNIAADPIPQASISFVYRDDPSPSAKRLIKHMRRYAQSQHRPDGLPHAPQHRPKAFSYAPQHRANWFPRLRVAP